ncbi:hypothetical protein MMC28_009644 [Mycoblastus sanguinarius]|nr:hypothetical protein [Mycoblastus sanguinarius]
MAVPRPRFRLDPGTVRNIRQRGLPPLEIHGLPPYEPAILGVLMLHLAFWSILTLPCPSPLYACLTPVFGIVPPIMVLVYIFQPDKRSYLFGPLVLSIIFFFMGLYLMLLKLPWAKATAATLSQLMPRPVENLPLVAFVQSLALLIFGLTLTFRSPDLSEPIEATIWPDGTMWITSQQRDGKLPREQIFEVHKSEQLSSRSSDIKREEKMEMSVAKFAGYYGPKLHDHTLPGLVFVTFGLVNLLTSLIPAVENRALHASVPVHIFTGAMAVRISSIERPMEQGIRAAFRVVGILAMIYGFLLGKSLNYFSGLL